VIVESNEGRVDCSVDHSPVQRAAGSQPLAGQSIGLALSGISYGVDRRAKGA